MRDDLNFAVEWTDAASDPAAARLKIEVAGKNACRAENRWSQTVDEAPHLSALPLAVWLASSWWRLRWESAPMATCRDTSWRMAHEVGASGGGFLWPRLTFLSDGEVLVAECRPSAANSYEMLRYLASFDDVISIAAFETSVTQFVDLVLERLAGKSAVTPLAALWADVLAERADCDMATYRRFEAMLGFDPDDGPKALMARLISLIDTAGVEAAAEVAAVCGGETPDERLSSVFGMTEAPSVRGKFEHGLVDVSLPDNIAVHDRGRVLAHRVRNAAGIGAEKPVQDNEIAGLLGLTVQQLTQADAPGAALLALAITEEAGIERYVFQKRKHLTGRRFQAARLLCDGLARPTDKWHPASNAYTARQKLQRAFAAEFLAPIDSLAGYLDGDYSEDAIAGAVEYFDVSSYTIGAHLSNNGYIPHNHPAVPY